LLPKDEQKVIEDDMNAYQSFMADLIVIKTGEYDSIRHGPFVNIQCILEAPSGFKGLEIVSSRACRNWLSSGRGVSITRIENGKYAGGYRIIRPHFEVKGELVLRPDPNGAIEVIPTSKDSLPLQAYVSKIVTCPKNTKFDVEYDSFCGCNKVMDIHDSVSADCHAIPNDSDDSLQIGDRVIQVFQDGTDSTNRRILVRRSVSSKLATKGWSLWSWLLS